MLIPALLYSFFLFLKLAARLGLTWELVSAWPLWLGVAIGVNLYKLDNLLSVFSYRLSVYGLSVFSLPVIKTDKPKTDKLETENRQPRTDNRSISQNILFAAGWAGVTLFGMTSTIGFLGKGVVLGVGLQLAVRVAKDLFEINNLSLRGMYRPVRPVAILGIYLKPERLGWFFAPIKRQLPKNEMAIAGLVFLGVFGVLSFL